MAVVGTIAARILDRGDTVEAWELGEVPLGAMWVVFAFWTAATSSDRGRQLADRQQWAVAVSALGAAPRMATAADEPDDPLVMSSATFVAWALTAVLGCGRILAVRFLAGAVCAAWRLIA